MRLHFIPHNKLYDIKIALIWVDKQQVNHRLICPFPYVQGLILILF